MGSILSVIATLFWGVLAGTIITGLVIYLMSELMGTLRVAIGALGVFLFFFLSFQFTAIVGAAKVKGVVSDIAVLNNTVSGKADWNKIENTYPVLEPYLDEVGRKLSEGTDKKVSALSLINNTINGFMWRRGAWALGGVLVCFGVAALPGLTGNGRSRQGRRGSSSAPHRRVARPRRPQRR